jgi:putative flippase GtrA
MDKIKGIWQGFAEKHPKISGWVREGGLFLMVSILITIFKYLILTFLPAALAFLGNSDFGFPGTALTLFGIEFKWYIIGYAAEQGGVSYFTAYMIAMVIGEAINFFIQRKYVFLSNGNIVIQGVWYTLAFCVVTCIVNSINCIWVAVAGHFVDEWLYNIGTTMLNGMVSMVVFFFVNKMVFKDKKNSLEK